MNEQRVRALTDDLMLVVRMGRVTASWVAEQFDTTIARHLAAAEAGPGPDGCRHLRHCCSLLGGECTCAQPDDQLARAADVESQQERFEEWAETNNTGLSLDQVFMSTEGVPDNPYLAHDTRLAFGAWMSGALSALDAGKGATTPPIPAQ